MYHFRMVHMIHPITSNYIKKFECLKCDFICIKKGDWSRHVLTAQHQNDTEMIQMIHPITSITSNSIHKCCSCGKEYKHHSGLSVHKKKCNKAQEPQAVAIVPPPPPPPPPTTILEPFKQMICEQTKMMLEQNIIATEQNKIIMNIVEKIATKANKPKPKPFNLKNFLNDTCKHALTVQEFTQTLQVEIDDLIYLRKKGYISGYAKIFAKNLSRLDKYQKPFWNTDDKRQTIYVKKEDGGWIKDNEHKAIKRAIRIGIYGKCFLTLKELKDNDPEMNDPEHKKNDEWLETFQCIHGKEPWHTFQDIQNQEEERSIEKVITLLIPKMKVPREKGKKTDEEEESSSSSTD